MKEDVKWALLVPRGVTAAVPRRLPFLLMKSRLSPFLLILFDPAIVTITKAF